MKVRFFQFHNYVWEDCEGEINDWIEAKAIKVHHTELASASTGTDEDRGSTTTVAIWYEE